MRDAKGCGLGRAEAIGNKVHEPDRNPDIEYAAEKAKEKLDYLTYLSFCCE
ncbi:MAG TPA: hypothetical protein VF172_05270 [Nitrososphaera sp.]|jgi:hypothetical protein